MHQLKAIRLIIIATLTLFIYSCNQSDIGAGNSADQLLRDDTSTVSLGKQAKDSPQKVYQDFLDMKRMIQNMSREEIEILSDEEVLKIGEPIIKAAGNKLKLNKRALLQLQELNSKLVETQSVIDKKQHKNLSEAVKRILSSPDNTTKRNLDEKDIRNLFSIFNNDGVTSMSMSMCESMFNVQNGDVLLAVGDNFSIANSVCPSGTDFIILPGTHTGQSVTVSKNGNMWTAYSSAIMDGQGSTGVAFDQGLDNNTISLFTIKNYNSYGISSSSGTENIDILYMTFENIAPNASSGPNHDPGQENSAIYFEDTENLYIRYSSFEDVASSIRIRFSTGPLKILDNEALNSGRNFFQCDECNGAGIRINDNSMERTSQYGNSILEDWINIFKSEGLHSDPIQIKHNRARGHGKSDSGSFIMLGDHGGLYQEAIDNIGVNPGQVGIGTHGGHHMKVLNNKMFSVDWYESSVSWGSNVAFSSYNATLQYSCSNHVFEDNVADWDSWVSGYLAKGHAPEFSTDDDYCGITHDEIWNDSDVVDEDPTMGASIWNSW